MKFEGVGLLEVSVEGFRDEGETGCLTAVFSFGIIRPEESAGRGGLRLAPSYMEQEGRLVANRRRMKRLVGWWY